MNKVIAFLEKQKGQIITESPSPVGVWLQGKLIHVEEAKLIVEFVVRKEMTNPMGMLHGGMIALIADELIGATVATLDLGRFYVSINLNTDFLYGAKLNQTITAETEIIRQGKNMINAECKIYNSDKKIIAKASSNLSISNLKK